MPLDWPKGEMEREEGESAMNFLINKMRDLFIDEEGQSTTEYILILLLVALIVAKFRSKFIGDGGIMEKILTQMETQIESSLK